MRKGLALAAAAMAFGTAMAADAVTGDTPLVVNGDVTLTTTDFEAYMERVPAARRNEFRASDERIKKTVEGLWIQRMLAQKARAAGLDKDRLVAARAAQAQDAVLADAYMAEIEKKVTFPNLEPRALEKYKADPKAYEIPEHVSIDHLLIGLNGRTREMAKVIAQDVHAEVMTGKEDFLVYAERYSDDPDKRRNGGKILGMSPSSFEPQITAQLAKMKKVGEIAGPIETRHGFHIIRLTERRPARMQTFAEVKDKLIADEKVRLVTDARNAATMSARSDEKNQIFVDRIEALRTEFKPPDPGALSKVVPGQR